MCAYATSPLIHRGQAGALGWGDGNPHAALCIAPLIGSSRLLPVLPGCLNSEVKWEHIIYIYRRGVFFNRSLEAIIPHTYLADVCVCVCVFVCVVLL